MTTAHADMHIGQLRWSWCRAGVDGAERTAATVQLWDDPDAGVVELTPDEVREFAVDAGGGLLIVEGVQFDFAAGRWDTLPHSRVDPAGEEVRFPDGSGPVGVPRPPAGTHAHLAEVLDRLDAEELEEFKATQPVRGGGGAVPMGAAEPAGERRPGRHRARGRDRWLPREDGPR